VVEDLAHQAAHRLQGGPAGGHGGADEVGQPLLAEKFPPGAGASVMPSVYSSSRSPGSSRVSQQTGLPSSRPSGRAVGQAGGRTSDDPRRISGSGWPALIHRSRPGVEVQAGEHGGRKLAAADLTGDGRVDLDGDVGQVESVRRAFR
jgi:hypothetical protein